MSNETLLTRRGLFMKLGILFNGVVAATLAVPIVRFLLSSVTLRPGERLRRVGAARPRRASSRKAKRGWRRSAIRS